MSIRYPTLNGNRVRTQPFSPVSALCREAYQSGPKYKVHFDIGLPCERPLCLRSDWYHSLTSPFLCTAEKTAARTYVLRGTILNRTYRYGTRKKTTIYFAIFTNNIWFYLIWSPVIVRMHPFQLVPLAPTAAVLLYPGLGSCKWRGVVLLRYVSKLSICCPFQNRSPVLGTNHSNFKQFVPKTGLRF